MSPWTAPSSDIHRSGEIDVSTGGSAPPPTQDTMALDKGKGKIIDLTENPVGEDKVHFSDLRNTADTIWAKRIMDEKFIKFVLLDDDKDRLMRMTPREWKHNPLILVKQLIRSAALLQLVSEHSEEICEAVSPEQQTLRRAAKTREETLGNQLSGLKLQIEGQDKKLEKLSKDLENSEKAKSEAEKAKEAAERSAEEKVKAAEDEVAWLTAELGKAWALTYKRKAQV
ncbi:hypothetical protein RIF29_28906 [Crotalaria pallida]|uniref:Uncharacterized protein n=1 Tax=Crotalaria pallida TaxID=3830 RepID=A0AAN9EIS0_CROPI